MGCKIGKKTGKTMSKRDVIVPLDIPDVRVLRTELGEKNELIIVVESVKGGARCRKCGQWVSKLHGQDTWVTIRHLPVFGRPSYLRYRPKRYQCGSCEGHPTTTEKLDWHESNSPHSFAYDEHILLQLINSTIEDVSRKEAISYDSVLGTLERRIESEVDWSRYIELGVLGLDEIALKKGQRDYVTLVTTRNEQGDIHLLGVLSGRTKDEVIDFLRKMPEKLQKTVKTVCCDLWEGFIEAVQQEIPEAQIVADRFHVSRHYRDAADGVRKNELQRLKKELPTEQYKKLKGSMWAFRKSTNDLTPEEKKVLNLFFRLAPLAKKAYKLRERLTAIFEMHITKAQAQKKIRVWIKKAKASGLSCFNSFFNTLERWWHEITNYFLLRQNSGFVEGFNNKVKVLKRRTYGLYNLKHLFQRIYLDMQGYRLFARPLTTIYG
jgi:transposase